MRIINPAITSMPLPYDADAPRKPINLTANTDLVGKAKAANINLSATFEQALAAALRQRQAEQWLAENQKAMVAYNDHVETHGVFSDGLRAF